MSSSGMNRRKAALVSAAVVLAGASLTALIFLTEPKATRIAATRETAMLVEVTGAGRGDFRPVIIAMGTVEPYRDVILRPRVSGEVMERTPAFTPGGFVLEGDLLLRIDPADYRNVLQQRSSELRQAEADLRVEMGRRNIALKDYQLLDETLSPENEALVLREPQLNAARARVEAARAALEQAELDLRRTRVGAPFDAHVVRREVSVGSQVSAGDDLGRLVGLDTYWVEAALPLSSLRWISFPDSAGEEGSAVLIRNHSAWPEGVYREGRIYRLVGTLEDRTRMARVLISVRDPLALGEDLLGLPPLIIGSYVETRIEGKVIEDVVRLDRDLVRKDDTVWVMEDGVLRIRDVEIVLRDAEYAYIGAGLGEGDRVVVTSLTTVVDGAPLRVGEGSSSDPGAREEPAGTADDTSTTGAAAE